MLFGLGFDPPHFHRSDEELAAAIEEAEANFVCEIQLQDWHLVRKYHMQSQVLTAAEQQGALGVEMLLDKIRGG